MVVRTLRQHVGQLLFPTGTPKIQAPTQQNRSNWYNIWHYLGYVDKTTSYAKFPVNPSTGWGLPD